MPTYRITQVSANQPKTWSFEDKRTHLNVEMETYKVMLEGVEDPVDVNRKAGNAPKTGEELSGAIEKTDFGQKFKAERKPYTPNAPFKDGPEIKAMWSIGQAIEWVKNEDKMERNLSIVEVIASELFAMVGRVKMKVTSNDSGLSFDGIDTFKAAYDAKPITKGQIEKVFDLTPEEISLFDEGHH